jgi:hypothetical protein
VTTATPSLSPVLHDIRVSVVSAEEASLGVAELWSGDRLIGFTRIEDGDLAPIARSAGGSSTPSRRRDDSSNRNERTTHAKHDHIR